MAAAVYQGMDAAKAGEGFAAMMTDLALVVAALGAGFLAGYATRYYVVTRRKGWCFPPNGKYYRQT